MVEVSLTVGKLDASLALLLTKDHHLIEFPTILLPNGVKSGSIVKIRCDRDLETEQEEEKQFQAIQDEILATFGKNLPQNPILKIKNVTQTSCVLEWDQLELGTASLKNLVLFKDGKKLGTIPQPLTNRTTKLSGLPIDKLFQFQLRLDTTAGAYLSETIEVKTHKMTDLSGITVCLGDISPNEHFTVDDIQATLKNMGAHYPAQDKLRVDTTHYITTRENKQNPEFLRANEMNIPIIRPEWLKACERERRIVGVRDFYVKDCALPEIFAKNYWQKAPAPPAKDENKEPEGEAHEGTSDAVEEPKEPKEEPKKTEPVQEESEQKEQPAKEGAESEANEEDEPVKPNEPETAQEFEPSEPVEEVAQKVEQETDNNRETESDPAETNATEFQNVDLGDAAEPEVDTETEEEPKEARVAAVEEELSIAPNTASNIADTEEIDISAPIDGHAEATLTEQEAQEKIRSITEQVKDEAQVSIPAISSDEVNEPENVENVENIETAENAENAEDAEELDAEETPEEDVAEEKGTNESKPAAKKKNKKKKKGKK